MINTSLHALVWLILSGLFFAGGEYLLKRYVLNPSSGIFLVLMASYIIGALLWLPALKQKPDLAITGTLWSVITLLMAVGIGVVIFGESLSIK
jgi:multidrug transporter EmrE-like cation transporter